MPHLVHQLIRESAACRPDALALIHGETRWTYRELDQAVRRVAGGLIRLGVQAGDRIAVYLDKCPEAVTALFAASAAGGAFVPINPQLKAAQVEHVLADSGARVLITSRQRLAGLAGTETATNGQLEIVLIDEPSDDQAATATPCTPWAALDTDPEEADPAVVETDLAALLYTSGSTGAAKGVALSHRNLIAGAESVVEYLGNTADDRLLAVLPLSFDYGLSQLTTAFRAGASVVLLNYLLPRDVVRAVASEGVTGLAAVPPLWVQLAELEWPEAAQSSLRYITNSGGTLPQNSLNKLRTGLPATDIVLMYGLTEAFRSTYLPPTEIDRGPDAIGIPIPNAAIRVVRDDGSDCSPGEPGELVHRGPLVAMGYWNDPERTAERFRSSPGQPNGIPRTETAVWSGDTVRWGDDGYLYFVGRHDEMIKTSGYRVSPGEIEAIIDASGLAGEAAAFGVPDEALGEVIVVAAAPTAPGERPDAQALRESCQQGLPSFMVPRWIQTYAKPLPRNANGKIDRQALRRQHQDQPSEDSV
jgi:acyl-CoA ligase (AMP-forming) (exosortase A-associated)